MSRDTSTGPRLASRPSAFSGPGSGTRFGNDSGAWSIQPDRRVLIGALIAGFAFDVLVSHPFGLSSMLALVVAFLAVAPPSPTRGPVFIGVMALAVAFAALLVARDSPWLSWLNMLAALGLMTIAIASRPSDGGVTPAVERVARVTPVARLAGRAPNLLFRAVGNEASSVTVDRTALVTALRAVAITIPTVVALVVLLATADGVFASFLDPPIDTVGVGRHGSLVITGAALALGATAVAISSRADRTGPGVRRLGSAEAVSVLASFVLVEVMFITSQAAAVVGGDDYVQSTTGLTYAEYARRGFFQLLAAAALALAVIWVVDHLTRAIAPSARRWVNRLGLAVVALTISIVAFSIRRLVLYEQEFGLTMLRLFTTVFAAWLAVVFAAAAVHLVRGRGSLVVSIAASAMVGLLAMNALNPEAVVARRNLDRFGGTDRLDIDYLVDALGADAAPVLYDHPSTRDVLCERTPPEGDPPLTFNLSRHRARTTHELRC